MVLFGAKPHNVQAIFSLPTITVGTVALPLNVLLTIAIGLGIMIALQLFVKKTKLGKAMRAVPQDKDASTLVGINVNKIITTTFAIGSGLAAVAALMYCATYPRVTNDMGSMMGMKAFIAAVLGGIGIIPGAMLGGILIGLIEIFVKLFAPRLVRGCDLRAPDRHPAGQTFRHPGQERRRESVREREQNDETTAGLLWPELGWRRAAVCADHAGIYL